MKKSTIWLLTIVMACTIIGLLYVQIMYMENMIKMRNEQFSETVMRSLYAVSSSLEQDETRYYLEQDLNESGKSLNELAAGNGSFAAESNTPLSQPTTSSIKDPLNQSQVAGGSDEGNENFDFDGQYQTKQNILKGQYLYQRGLLNEVILSILNQASDRPIAERADAETLNNYLKHELESNGLKLPYEYAVVGPTDGTVYKSAGYNGTNTSNIYSQVLFPNDPVNKQNTLKVTFPSKSDYIFSSIKFMIPSFAFTFILMFIFIYTIVLAFKQKKLSEMKNDFINNMTHEFKTPISTISLAAQMLKDDSVLKSPAMLKHASTVINDETKRLRFQVEKVLQMSMFDRKSATMRLTDVDANAIIDNVVNTYKIKVEKFGGRINTSLNAEDSIVNVDEMHFTNVIFNLLDNAVKYRREDVEPELTVSTRNLNDETLEIKIRDNGIGIRREDLKKIFEKFYRVSTGNRHDVKGFGLGLAYVYKMVNLFKGHIKAESEINKGSTFIITLPLLK